MILPGLFRLMGLSSDRDRGRCSNCGKRNSTVRATCVRCHEPLD